MDDMSEKNAENAIDDAFSLCADFENLISMTKESSDIYRINHSGGKPVECSPETVEVVKMGIEYGDLSGGLFDITIGKVSDLWDFHSEDAEVPGKKAIADALKDVDYTGISISGDNSYLVHWETKYFRDNLGRYSIQTCSNISSTAIKDDSSICL